MRFILLLCIFLLCGCSSLRFPWQPGNLPKKQYSSEEILEVVIGERVRHEFRTLAEESKPKASLLDKLKALGFIGILLGVASLFFPPLAVFFGLVGRGMEFGAKRIVQGVELALEKMQDPIEKQQFLDTLSKSYDNNTKLLVAKLKNKV